MCKNVKAYKKEFTALTQEFILFQHYDTPTLKGTPLA